MCSCRFCSTYRYQLKFRCKLCQVVIQPGKRIYQCDCDNVYCFNLTTCMICDLCVSVRIHYRGIRCCCPHSYFRRDRFSEFKLWLISRGHKSDSESLELSRRWQSTCPHERRLSRGIGPTTAFCQRGITDWNSSLPRVYHTDKYEYLQNRRFP